jgi:hypothetical protein
VTAAIRFRAERAPSPEQLAALAAYAPDNPFEAPGYAAARSAVGAETWLLWLDAQDHLVVGCTAFITSGRLRRQLEIPSMPDLPPVGADQFWGGLRGLCRKLRVSDLAINSFGSVFAAGTATTPIPVLGDEIWRKRRREHVLDLTAADLWQGLSSNHRRNVARARKAGVVVRSAAGADGVAAHVQAMAQSTSRRQARGEDVSGAVDVAAYAALVECEAAVLFQAALGSEREAVVSSVLVLMASKGAYYHSAGTLPEGMAAGASHFLISEVAERLRERGCRRFNLGGANLEEEGLARFKAGFGAAPIELEAAQFNVATGLRRALITMWGAYTSARGR